MVVLRCPQKNDANTKISWTNHTRQRMNPTSMSGQAADGSQMDVLLQGGSLVILRASLSYQGNYSCSVSPCSILSCLLRETSALKDCC
ncbi:hypothetical protein GOODEAATRI_029588 [Goodea atripinnis]|uniref:Ig-like domain-containing protein n=1 Tax=Goodea atripinnis TaxID=208336 RepID=A0ABV0PSZ0_9TELE